ncbi:hypothetical protein AZE42_13013 [Rhizopogon vesiculosus]|uniref:Uncharacterized protein n=1 Tax=Rhizopogon vesiculosus TaxID=180088 RepID=A0A1J8PRC3_9AGAM|nr:hypothetical protein AZE42_13013 [Rhizopogon vesiculosus]
MEQPDRAALFDLDGRYRGNWIRPITVLVDEYYGWAHKESPLMWLNQYKPRNRIPWIIIGICNLACPILLLTVRFILARENKKRDAEPVNDAYEEVYIEQVTADGKRIEVRVDKEFLDLTDVQNRDFRYVL